MKAARLYAVTLLEVESVGQHVFSIESKLMDGLKAPRSKLPVGALVVGLGADLDLCVPSSQKLVEQHLVDVAGDPLSSKLRLKAAEERFPWDVLDAFRGEPRVFGGLQEPQN